MHAHGLDGEDHRPGGEVERQRAAAAAHRGSRAGRRGRRRRSAPPLRLHQRRRAQRQIGAELPAPSTAGPASRRRRATRRARAGRCSPSPEPVSSQGAAPRRPASRTDPERSAASATRADLRAGRVLDAFVRPSCTTRKAVAPAERPGHVPQPGTSACSAARRRGRRRPRRRGGLARASSGARPGRARRRPARLSRRAPARRSPDRGEPLAALRSPGRRPDVRRRPAPRSPPGGAATMSWSSRAIRARSCWAAARRAAPCSAAELRRRAAAAPRSAGGGSGSRSRPATG